MKIDQNIDTITHLDVDIFNHVIYDRVFPDYARWLHSPGCSQDT